MKYSLLSIDFVKVRGAFSCFTFLVILSFVFVNGIRGQQAQGPIAGEDLTFYFLKDSTFEKWVHLADCKFSSTLGQLKVDGAGNLFGLPMNAAGKRPMMLSDHGWIPWYNNLDENVNYLYTDGMGILYATSEHSLYYLSDSTWHKVITIGNERMPLPMVDGNIYNLRDPDGGGGTWEATKVQIMTLADGIYQPLGRGGKPLFLNNKKDRFVVDGKGKIYSYQDHEYGTPQSSVELYEYVEGKWKTIATFPTDIDDIRFDPENNLYVSGYDSDLGHYLKKWNGSLWEEVNTPAGVVAYTGFEILFDEKGQQYTEGQDENEHVKVIFRNENGNWIEVAREDKKVSIDYWIPASNNIYSVNDSKGSLDRFFGRWVYNVMEVAAIPLPSNLDADFELYYGDIRKKYIFRKGDKLGLQDGKGRILAYPVFDKIEVVRMPVEFPVLKEGEEERSFNDYALQLTSGQITFHVDVTEFIIGIEAYPDALLGFKRRVAKVCSICDGSGFTPDRQEEVVTRGKWVEGKTFQTTSGSERHFDISSSSWRNMTKVYTTTTPGYYEPDIITMKTIPGRPCPNCRSKGVFRETEAWIFDAGQQKYVYGWW
ncbi:MAG: hypothetical protein KBA14_04125 [Saprospiraceae bacterium]|nr:hypothetical protein [Saprospiraceae bacterium]